MKRYALILLVIILSFSIVEAVANINNAYNWLLQRQMNDVFEASLTALAVSRADSSRITPYVNFIISNKHSTEACWPNPVCNVKDSAAVLIAETKLGLGINVEEIINWLASKQTLASLSGTWNLQIVTPDSGKCSLMYQRQGESLSSEFVLNVDKGKISYGSCKDQYFFNLNSCLETSILNKPSTIIEVSCQSLNSASISVVYKEGNSIYLTGQPISTRARIRINNGFFDNKIETLNDNWALNEANSDINSLIYLKKNLESRVIDQALMYLITKETSFLNSLLQLQSNFGQFNDQGGLANEFSNGLSGLALQENGQHGSELENLKEWLGTRQKQDGSWSSDTKTTAVILYGVFQGGSLPVSGAQCGNNIKDPGEECDGSDLGGKTCSNLGLGSGSLTCVNCGIITTGCSNQSNNIPKCVLSNPKWLNTNGVSINSARGSQEGRIPGDKVLLTVDGNILCGNKQILFNIFEDEQGQDPLQQSLGPVSFNSQEGFGFVEWQPLWFDDNPLPDVTGDPEFYFFAQVGGSTQTSLNSSLLQITTPTITECSDGIDNDKNGFCDTISGICINESVQEGDIGCKNPDDLIENERALACVDGIDNDGDDLIDNNDPGCSTPLNLDNNEVDGECIADWSCDPWSPCSAEGTQSRVCRDLNACVIECNDNETCITSRVCPPVEDEIELPKGGEDDTGKGEEKESAISSNPCSINGICEPEWGEDENNCPQDCLPIETSKEQKIEKVDFGEEEEEEPIVEEEGRRSIWLYVVLLLLILVLLGTYFFVFKKPSKTKYSKTFGLPTQPSRAPIFGPQKQHSKLFEIPKETKKSKIEEELEKSIKEAKKLIGK